MAPLRCAAKFDQILPSGNSERALRVDDNGRWIIRWITPKDRVNDGDAGETDYLLVSHPIAVVVVVGSLSAR